MIDSLKRISETAIGRLIGSFLFTIFFGTSFVLSIREYIHTAPLPVIVILILFFLLLLLIAMLLLYLILHSPAGDGIYSSKYLIWYKLPIRKVSWDFSNFLGVSCIHGNPISINVFQVQFKVNWSDGISPVKAFLECKHTSVKQDVFVSALDEYVKVDKIEFIPTGEWFQCQSQFGDISKEKFLQKYDGFCFVFEYDKTVFSKTFSREELEVYLNRYSKYTNPRPEPKGTLRNST